MNGTTFPLAFEDGKGHWTCETCEEAHYWIQRNKKVPDVMPEHFRTCPLREGGSCIVLAGTYREFERWIENHGLQYMRERFIFGEAHNLMMRRVTSVIRIGTFSERRDAADIYALALHCIR